MSSDSAWPFILSLLGAKVSGLIIKMKLCKNPRMYQLGLICSVCNKVGLVMKEGEL